MYLSRLVLNQRDRAVRYDLADCQALHRRLLANFPERQEREPGARAQFGMLYRLDERTTGPIQILVQSHERPEWALPGGYLLRHGDMENPACRPVDEFYAAIEQGMVLRFRLRANPTKRVHPKSEPEKADWHGKRVELREEAQWLGWLMRKGEMHGFALPDSPSRPGSPNVRAVGEGKLGGRRPGGEEKDRLTLGSVLFNGTLAVTDPERFRAALATGIGSGKAYGFGLLSVARLE